MGPEKDLLKYFKDQRVSLWLCFDRQWEPSCVFLSESTFRAMFLITYFLVVKCIYGGLDHKLKGLTADFFSFEH